MITNEERVARIKKMVIPTAILSVMGFLTILELACDFWYPDIVEQILFYVTVAGNLIVYAYCGIFGYLFKVLAFPFKWLWYWGPFTLLFVLMVAFPLTLFALIMAGWMLPGVVVGCSYLKARAVG